MKNQFILCFIISISLFPCLSNAQNTSWTPVKENLTTPWTSKVTPQNVHKEYPRPQMRRNRWENLNGLWSYKITSALQNNYQSDVLENQSLSEGEILVPFPIESSLSGVKRALLPNQKLWYERSFSIPASWKGQRVILHFGAVDWQTTVWINGKKIGIHQGGYNPFSFDITNAIKGSGKQQIIVSVWDPSNEGFQPVGKQSLDPSGIWYSATSGIWQTVWIEPVPNIAIKYLKITPDIDNKTLHLIVNANKNESAYIVKAVAFDNGKKVAEATGVLGKNITLHLKRMKLWSPKDPFLYHLSISLDKRGAKIDEVKSYFAMRKISLGKDTNGVTRLFLNNKPLFEFGPLDQGFWPDGLYTAPTDEAMKFDIIKTKEWGFNMIRKHVKVEPERWYYYCDKLGMLVWQDMPSGDMQFKHQTAQSALDYKQELKQLIDEHYNHPCIVTWVPFNEGWGQFDIKGIVALIRKLDPTRLIDAATGGNAEGFGDMHDLHLYPGPGMYPAEGDQASVLGEFGGQALVVKGHLWLTDLSKAPTHYKTSTSISALHQKYAQMMDSLRVLKKKGLSAAVYTQTTDVEVEVNGLMTYDRRVMKFNEDSLRKMNQGVIYGEYNFNNHKN